jgi:hypothetical protein
LSNQQAALSADDFGTVAPDTVEALIYADGADVRLMGGSHLLRLVQAIISQREEFLLDNGHLSAFVASSLADPASKKFNGACGLVRWARGFDAC